MHAMPSMDFASSCSVTTAAASLCLAQLGLLKSQCSGKTHDQTCYTYMISSRVHKKEKGVSNCTIAAHKRCFRSTNPCMCMFSTTQWHDTIKTIVQKYARWP